MIDLFTTRNILFLIVHITYVLLLLPLTTLLAWQDWKSRQVNVGTVIATLIALVFNTYYSFHIVGVFSILWAYRCFRKNSIQWVDIFLFSFGAGCFEIIFLPIYCVSTALALVAVQKITQTQKLPFVTAWAISFWWTYFIKLCVN